MYNKRLKNIKGIKIPVEKPFCKNVYWMYGIVLDESTGFTASGFAKKLLEKEIATRPFFLGMHEQPVFRRMGLFKGESYPVSERIARQGLYIPSGLTLNEEQIDTVSEAIKQIISKNKSG